MERGQYQKIAVFGVPEFVAEIVAVRSRVQQVHRHPFRLDRLRALDLAGPNAYLTSELIFGAGCFIAQPDSASPPNTNHIQ
jgi:hypothetical protein